MPEVRIELLRFDIDILYSFTLIDSTVIMSLPGMGGMGMGAGQAAGVSPEQMQQMQMMKYVRLIQWVRPQSQ